MAAAAAFAIVLLLVLALIFGLQVSSAARGAASLVSVLLEPARPEPKRPPPKQPRREMVRSKSGGAKGAPSPRNLRNQATPVFAPKLPPLIVPPPIVSATQPALGQAAQTGASDRAGPGQGAAGLGNGTGGGGNGGEGEGYGSLKKRAHQIRGRLSREDLPKGLLAPGDEAEVGVRFVVDETGRAINCRVDRPSRSPQLDALVCRLISERFIYRPARDRAGRAVPSLIIETHSWYEKENEED